MIGASLSEHHTSGTALWKCVNVHACLQPYTVNFKCVCVCVSVCLSVCLCVYILHMCTCGHAHMCWGEGGEYPLNSGILGESWNVLDPLETGRTKLDHLRSPRQLYMTFYGHQCHVSWTKLCMHFSSRPQLTPSQLIKTGTYFVLCDWCELLLTPLEVVTIDCQKQVVGNIYLGTSDAR